MEKGHKEFEFVNPNKALRAAPGTGGVENVPLDEMTTQAEIARSIQSLRELFKGTTFSDFEIAFGNWNPKTLCDTRDFFIHMADNLARVYEGLEKKKTKKDA